MDESLVKKLMATLKCSVCGQHYEATNVQVLGRREELWFLSVSCLSCHSQGLVAAVIKEGKPQEIITDLTEEEFARLSEQPSVEGDDILEMHTFLKDFDGDFSSLFPKK
ncbi:MAG: hypothetical protein ACE5IA_08885 [Dehalococcoidia bacterium]